MLLTIIEMSVQTVLCDDYQKRRVFVLFVDPDDFAPSMTFFSLKDVPSQDAKGIETVIRQAFAKNDLSHLVFRMSFFFCKWWYQCKQWFKKWIHHLVKFAWCLPYRLELALKDSLVNAMDDIHEVLTFLFYLHKKTKKNWVSWDSFLKF